MLQEEHLLRFCTAVWVYSRGIEQNGNYKKYIKYKRIRILHTSLTQIPTIEVTWFRTLYRSLSSPLKFCSWKFLIFSKYEAFMRTSMNFPNLASFQAIEFMDKSVSKTQNIFVCQMSEKRKYSVSKWYMVQHHSTFVDQQIVKFLVTCWNVAKMLLQLVENCIQLLLSNNYKVWHKVEWQIRKCCCHFVLLA